MTLAPIAERLAVELSLATCFYDLGLSRLRFEHPTFRLRGERSKFGYHLSRIAVLGGDKYKETC